MKGILVRIQRRLLSLSVLGVCGVVLVAGRPGAQEAVGLRISKWADPSKLIPVSLSGFSGEVDSVLRFDLGIQGFSFVGTTEASYIITGSDSSRVEGHVVEAATKARVLDRAYSSGSRRVQAHALADDIIQAVTGKKGISLTRIAYKVDAGVNNEVVVSDYDGFGASRITQDNSLVFAPAWAPGKRVLYYTSYKLGNPDIYMHDLTTGARQIVARYTGLNTGASISPDGQRLAMILSKGGSPDVYVADVKGGSLVQLTRTREDESSPCWSPDSQTLCFVSRLQGRPTLYTVSSTGGAMKRLMTPGVANATEPDWSPDGKSIAFTTQRGGANFEICVVSAVGGDVKELVSGEDPSWASNSRTIIFSRRSKGGRVLSLLDVPTKQVKDVKHNLGSCSQPCWAR